MREKTHGEVVDTCEAAEPLSVFSGQNYPGGLRDYQRRMRSTVVKSAAMRMCAAGRGVGGGQDSAGGAVPGS